jgi:CHAP domain
MMREHTEGKGALWLAAGSVLGVGGVMFVAVLVIVAAVLGASFTGCQSAEAAVSGPAPSAYALQSIAPERLKLYERAGARFDVDWSFLASIGTQECASGTCSGVNGSGCAGPMQIASQRESPCSPGSGPTLWERFAVNADALHPLSVDDLADAIFTAARILHEAMGAPPIGGSFAEYRQAACRYYGACSDSTVAYAEEVMARAVQYGFQGAGSPAPTSPPLSEPIPANSEQCQATVLAPEAGGSSVIVKVAERQVGQGENPPGSNCTMYGPCEEWCSLFAAWVWQHAGVPLPGTTALYGYSGSLYTWAAQHGSRMLPPDARPAPGDAVFYGTGPGDSAHVGIVVAVLPGGEIETVEGNYAGHVTRVGPFTPAHPVREAAAIYGYAQPPAPRGRA